MRTAIKTAFSIVIAGSALASLSACSNSDANAFFGDSQLVSADAVQYDTYNHAVPGINRALEQGKSLAEISANLNHYLKPQTKAEQINLINGSCGLNGPKDYTLAVGDGNYIYVYTSRTETYSGSFDKTPQALIAKGCGVFGLDAAATPSSSVG